MYSHLQVNRFEWGMMDAIKGETEEKGQTEWFDVNEKYESHAAACHSHLISTTMSS